MKVQMLCKLNKMDENGLLDMAHAGICDVGGTEIKIVEMNEMKNENSLTTDTKDSILSENIRIRRLTPKECTRLMGFRDKDYEAMHSVNSDTQVYKQCGNSIVVDVLYHIFKQMCEV